MVWPFIWIFVSFAVELSGVWGTEVLSYMSHATIWYSSTICGRGCPSDVSFLIFVFVCFGESADWRHGFYFLNFLCDFIGLLMSVPCCVLLMYYVVCLKSGTVMTLLWAVVVCVCVVLWVSISILFMLCSHTDFHRLPRLLFFSVWDFGCTHFHFCLSLADIIPHWANPDSH